MTVSSKRTPTEVTRKGVRSSSTITPRSPARCLRPGGASADVRVMVVDQASNDAPFSYEPVLSKCDGGKLKAAASYAQCLGNLLLRLLAARHLWGAPEEDEP